MLKQYVVFTVNSSQYGIPLAFVEEFDTGITVVQIEGSVPEIAGLATRRGQLVTLLDLHEALSSRGESNKRAAGHSRKTILLDSAALTHQASKSLQRVFSSQIALQVDSIDYIQSFQTELVTPPAEEMKERHIDSICTHGGRIVHFLSIESLVDQIYRKGHVA